MAEELLSIDESLHKTFDNVYKSTLSRYLTFGEFVGLIVDFANLACSFLAGVDSPGPGKKQLILDFVGRLFDVLWPRLVLPTYLLPFKSLGTPLFRRAAIAIAGASVEKVYQRFVKPAVQTATESPSP